ncbi:CDGSH iron-sulfur domain-containing protein 3, mitochondrial-like [Diorhabda sublineata]|uniref:CDGSH iron-sulfur domain-containing protein 3, mitochondrial-like n=1 Tax=Diorhabda sublineata TaxID=1163346 RepID=UPI0024E13B69|nr:CDGSH iron-sulfur domain-containing protein 3, mitochondrial-like [Diorhabda sublineata]
MILSRVTRLHLRNLSKVYYSTSSDVLPKNIAITSAQFQTNNGTVYDKKPLKIYLQAGKKYSWCLCGRSRSQPFCDGTHRIAQLKITQKPVRLIVEESKEYWLCNCKHTAHRPFCDGTHKSKEVQDSTSIIRQ